MPRRYCAISLDCDTLAEDFHPFTGKQDCYELPRGRSLELLLPRFLDWLKREGVRATLFVIGRDLDETKNSPLWRRVKEEGHEVGNHTWGHPQNFSTLAPEGIREEIVRGREAIERNLGVRPEGFRAPGYTMTPEILRMLEETGHAYDSSLNASPSYIAAKRVYRRLLSHRATLSSQSTKILALPRDVFDFHELPAGKWRTDRPFREFPITLVPFLGLPFVTSLLHSWRSVFQTTFFREICRRHQVVNLELHLIEFLDRADIPSPVTFLATSILRRPLEYRLHRFSRLLSIARQAGLAIGPLCDAPPPPSGAGAISGPGGTAWPPAAAPGSHDSPD